MGTLAILVFLVTTLCVVTARPKHAGPFNFDFNKISKGTIGKSSNNKSHLTHELDVITQKKRQTNNGDIFQCNFEENDWCGMIDDPNDDGSWLRQTGPTGSKNTGPLDDHTTGSGYYAYMEATDQHTGDIFKLWTPEMSLNEQGCLEFFYNMYGGAMGTLNVSRRLKGEASESIVFTKVGDQGQDWHRSRVTLNAGQFSLGFVAISGSDYQSDIAIDDILITTGHCTVCPDPGQGTHASTTDSDFSLDSTVTYTCSTGYTTSDPLSITCQDNGQWDNSSPICTPIVCPDPGQGTQASTTNTDFTIGSSVTYTCNTGYTTSDPVSITCQDNGQWDDSAPICTPIVCPDPGQGTEASTTDTDFTFGSTVTYTCNTGYTTSDPVSITCQSNGQWDNSAPTCTHIVCPDPGQGTQASTTDTDFTFGSTVTYTCNNWYTTSDPLTITCQNNGQWDNSAPTCTGVCDETIILNEPGFIMSPGFPTGYPDNLFCTWTVIAPEGQVIHVKFGAMDIEYDESCIYDILVVNGKKYCGRTMPGDFVTNNNEFDITFLSDERTSSPGFIVHYDFSAVCSCGYSYHQILKTCYRVVHTSKTWDDARADCQTVSGGDLIEVTSKDVNDFVMTSIRPTSDTWLGARRYDADDIHNFVWVKSNTPVADYDTFWKPGQPDNQGNEMCMEVKGKWKAWNDMPCKLKRHYICQH